VKQIVTVDGRRIAAYEELGSGPRLVCVPGGPGYGGEQLGNLGGLDATRRLVLCDLRGAGDSDDPVARTWAVADYARDLEQVRIHLGLEQIAIMGHAHGALTAARYALDHPDRVTALVLDAVPVRRIEDVDADSSQGMDGYFAKYDDRARRYVSEHMGQIQEDALAWFWDNEASDDLAAPLLDVKVPTLLIDGSKDPTGGDTPTRELAGRMHDCAVAVIKGASHFPWVDQPRLYVDVVEEFLSKFPV
jgi:pimeloyl-ACP methyl ester carboxylesterase